MSFWVRWMASQLVISALAYVVMRVFGLVR